MRKPTSSKPITPSPTKASSSTAYRQEAEPSHKKRKTDFKDIIICIYHKTKSTKTYHSSARCSTSYATIRSSPTSSGSSERRTTPSERATQAKEKPSSKDGQKKRRAPTICSITESASYNTVKYLHAEIERRDAANAELKRTIEQLRDEIADLHRKYKVLRIADHIR